jgi:hypothetical protein
MAASVAERRGSDHGESDLREPFGGPGSPVGKGQNPPLLPRCPGRHDHEAGDRKDDVRLGDGFYIAFRYEDDDAALDESGFLKAVFLELKSDDVEEMRRDIVAFGVKVLEVPDPHLYFQAPGGQVFRLTGTSEDLSRYEGTGHGEQFVGDPFSVQEI